ncbi:hypothetical protein C2G38_2177236 [Gigaspora rosea]|uniref:MULE transposase domain-containing protein n=1 Tax=Gigaspora rosea TaxID=44941 RepID=A0A397VFI5_9GLOM|nr:hypothetical protein C2G38_2177236 [Gigaspora rosea]
MKFWQQLKDLQNRTTKKDRDVANFLGITNPETVYIIRQGYDWERYQEAIGKKKKVKKKQFTPDLLENIAKETFSRKLALTLSETGTIDYRNKEIEQQILAFLNSIEEGTPTFCARLCRSICATEIKLLHLSMAFAFVNNTNEDTFINYIENGNTFTNYVKNIPTSHTRNTFTSHIDNMFTNHIDNTFTNQIDNTFTSHINNAFASHIDDIFANEVMQIDEEINRFAMNNHFGLNASSFEAIQSITDPVNMNDDGAIQSITNPVNISENEAIQSTMNPVNMNEDSFVWNSLPNFLQAIFLLNYSYIIQHIINLPPYYTNEEQSKSTMPQSKGYEIKGDSELKHPESARNRNTGCLATLHLRLERWRLSTSHPLEVNVCFKHNHIVNSAELLSFRCVNEKIRDKFIQMFCNGHSSASALYNHEDELHVSASSNENLIETLADRAVNPDYTYVLHLYEQYRNSQLGGPNGVSMFQRLSEEVLNYNLSVHKEVRESSEICYMDASASFEPLNTSVTLLYTSCVAGALPLGVFITSDELAITIEKAINLLKLILPEYAFFGQGRDLGLQNFLTDDSAAKRKALNVCWPQSNRLLCTFHILQAFWRWLYNLKHGIDKEDRINIMNQMKKIILWNRHQYWARCFCVDLLIRGNHTNNYVECGFGLLKDIIFARTKAYNSVQVFYFIIKNMERFYQCRLYEFAHRHPGHMEVAKRFLCLGWDTIDKNSIQRLSNANEFLIPSAPCKHQSAIAMKYHIKIINFLPSLTPEDRMIFGFVASGVSAKNCLFYAFLHTTSILIDQTDKQKTSQTEKNSQMNELKNNQTDEQKNNQTNNQKNNQKDNINRNINKNNKFREFEKNEIEIDNINNSSFDEFLEEIRNDYKNCGPQLRKAFETFTERYRAEKSLSIAQAISFLYNPNSSTQIKSGAAICVQPESVKRRKTRVGNSKRRYKTNKVNIFQEIPKCKAWQTNKKGHNLSNNILSNVLN